LPVYQPAAPDRPALELEIQIHSGAFQGRGKISEDILKDMD